MELDCKMNHKKLSIFFVKELTQFMKYKKIELNPKLSKNNVSKVLKN